MTIAIIGGALLLAVMVASFVVMSSGVGVGVNDARVSAVAGNAERATRSGGRLKIPKLGNLCRSTMVWG